MTTRQQQLQDSLFPEADADIANPRADEAKLPVKRGPGRPPGALNRATKDMREYLLANFSDPLIGRAQVAMMRPQELATALGCTLLEAFDRIQQARDFVTQYVHQELPKAVEISGGGAVILNIGDVGAGQAPAIESGGTVTITGTLSAAPQQDQALKTLPAPELDNGKSDK